MPGLESTNELRPYTAEELHEIFQARISMKGLLKGQSQNQPAYRAAAQMQPHLADEDDVDLEEIGVDDSYWPSKLAGKESGDQNNAMHPNKVVEAATLCSVKAPDISNKLSLAEKVRDSIRFSDIQLEATIQACLTHEQLLASGQRAGFLLGDGAGMGKGRTLAAIIYENFKLGRKRAVWISMSDNLIFDVERDLMHIGAKIHIKVAPIGKFQFNNISCNENENEFRKGLICCTYAELIGESAVAADATASHSTHVSQLVQWLGKNGVIVLDECHKATSLSRANTDKFMKTCTSVLKLQQLLPMTRVVYASATGASEPRNMVYMSRLGLWGSGTSYCAFSDFVNAVEKRGDGAMKLVAIDLKMRGFFVSRQLSFHNVRYRIEEVPMTREFRKFYDYSADLWAKINEQLMKAFRRMCLDSNVQEKITRQFWAAHRRYFQNLCSASKLKHVVKIAEEAKLKKKAVVIGLQSSGECGILQHLERPQGTLTGVVSTARTIIQSFIEKYFPAPTNEYFDKLLKTGTFNSETSLNPTGSKRARTNFDWSSDDMDANDSDEDSPDEDDDNRPKSGHNSHDSKGEKTIEQRILKQLCYNTQDENEIEEEFQFDFDTINPQTSQIKEDEVKRCMSAREKFLSKIQQLARRMPPNTMDKLILELGGTEQVAEISNRRGRVSETAADTFKYELRDKMETNFDLVNYNEKESFMDGNKLVAIISEPASCGISLHSDRCVSNQRPRLHIALELPWSVDRAIQQFGRTHRTDQVNKPELVMLVTDLSIENHLANMVAKQLQSLGARHINGQSGTTGDFPKINIDSTIGCSALDSVLQQITGKKPLESAHVPESYEGDFVFDCCEALAGVGILSVGLNNIGQRSYVLDYASNNITMFFDRILGCRLEVQNALFKFFLNKMHSLMLQVKRTGHFDLGIIDLEVHDANVTVTKLISFKKKYAAGTAVTELHTLEVERGMSFQLALLELKKKIRHAYEGFYMLKEKRNNNNCAILCLSVESVWNDTGTETERDHSKINLKIYRPNTGAQVRTETLSSIGNRYVVASPKVAQQFWDMQYHKCLHMCSHIYWTAKCSYGKKCGLGLRVRTFHVLSGLMVSIWERVALIIENNGRQMQMVRVKIDDNKKIVGIIVPYLSYRRLVADLTCDAIVETKDFNFAQRLNSY